MHYAVVHGTSRRPMDFADATLVQLARRESLFTFFTIDHSDFETYRVGGRQRFQIVPAREPQAPAHTR